MENLPVPMDPKGPSPTPQGSGKIIIPNNLLKLIQNLLILLGLGMGGVALHRSQTDVVPVPVPVPPVVVKLVPKETFIGKKCEFNTFEVAPPAGVTEVTFILIENKETWTYKVTGNAIDFIPKKFPFKFGVTAIKDGKIMPPEWVCVKESDTPPPGPPPEPPNPPIPPDPKPPNPTDPFETAIRTGWQAEFSPDKVQTKDKLITMYQFLLTKVDSKITYGDLGTELSKKATELGIVGKALALQTALNTEMGKLLPHSPSVLVEPTVANLAFNKAITVLQQLR